MCGIWLLFFVYDFVINGVVNVIDGYLFEGVGLDCFLLFYVDFEGKVDVLVINGIIIEDEVGMLKLDVCGVLIDYVYLIYVVFIVWVNEDVVNVNMDDGVWKLLDGDVYYWDCLV